MQISVLTTPTIIKQPQTIYHDFTSDQNSTRGTNLECQQLIYSIFSTYKNKIEYIVQDQESKIESKADWAIKEIQVLVEFLTDEFCRNEMSRAIDLYITGNSNAAETIIKQLLLDNNDTVLNNICCKFQALLNSRTKKRSFKQMNESDSAKSSDSRKKTRLTSDQPYKNRPTQELQPTQSDPRSRTTKKTLYRWIDHTTLFALPTKVKWTNYTTISDKLS